MSTVATCAVIESDSAARRLLSHILTDTGCAVVTSAHGQDLTSRLLRYRPALLFLDIDLGTDEAGEILDVLGEHGFNGAVQIVSDRYREPAIPILNAGRRRGLRMLKPLCRPFDAGTIRNILTEERLIAEKTSANTPPAVVRQLPWRSPASTKSGLLDLAVDHLEIDNAPFVGIDGLRWWREYGPPYLAGLIAQCVPMVLCVPLSLADLDMLGDFGKCGYGHIFPTPIFVFSEDDIFSDLAAARERLRHIRHSRAMVRITGCGTRFFSSAGHDPLAVDHAIMAPTFAADASTHRNRIRHLAELTRRAGGLLLAEEITPELYGAELLAGVDLLRLKGVKSSRVPATPPPSKTARGSSAQAHWRPVAISKALSRRTIE